MSTPTQNKLYVTDDYIFERLGVCEKYGRIAIKLLEKKGQFPKKDPLFSNKRYWPAVLVALDKRNGVGNPDHHIIDCANDNGEGDENWDD